MYDKLENWKWYSKEADVEEKIKKRSCRFVTGCLRQSYSINYSNHGLKSNLEII